MSLAEKPSATKEKIPSAEELVARAKTLAPKLRERAVRAERDRNIPKESVEEYIDAGLIHTLQPKRWGGYEHDHEVAFDILISGKDLPLRAGEQVVAGRNPGRDAGRAGLAGGAVGDVLGAAEAHRGQGVVDGGALGQG